EQAKAQVSGHFSADLFRVFGPYRGPDPANIPRTRALMESRAAPVRHGPWSSAVVRTSAAERQAQHRDRKLRRLREALVARQDGCTEVLGEGYVGGVCELMLCRCRQASMNSDRTW